MEDSPPTTTLSEPGTAFRYSNPGYMLARLIVERLRDWYHPGCVSHGVVASTPSETARFLHGLFGGLSLGNLEAP
jgi:hypothetical protein